MSTFKVPKLSESDQTDWQYDELELSPEQQNAESISNFVSLDIRVLYDETNKFSLSLKRNANDTFMALTEELGELLGESKYKFSLFY